MQWEKLEQQLEQPGKILPEVGAEIALQSMDMRISASAESLRAGMNMLMLLCRLISENGSATATVALMGAANILKQLVKINREEKMGLPLHHQFGQIIAAAQSNPSIPEASPLTSNYSYLEIITLKGNYSA